MKKKIQRYLSGEREGFSLIELIIVIAIMAILIGVIALVVLPYLESGRENRDRQTLSEVSNAFKSAMANEAVAKAVSGKLDSDTKIPNDSNADIKKLTDKMESYMDGKISDAKAGLASKACKGGDFYVQAKQDTATKKWTMKVCIKNSSGVVKDSDNKDYSSDAKDPATESE